MPGIEIYWSNIRVILGLYWDNGKEHRNYYLGFNGKFTFMSVRKRPWAQGFGNKVQALGLVLRVWGLLRDSKATM